MKRSGIYGIYNTANGKWYVGQTCDLERRECVHMSRLRRGTHSNPYLRNAALAYGSDFFEFRILEETTEDMLDVREKAWIALYRSNEREFGYNLEDGGSRLKHHSQETKERISKILTGRVMSDSARLAISIGHIGIKHTEEEKRKIGESQKGKIIGPDVRKKMSDAAKVKVFSKEHRLKLSLAQIGREMPLRSDDWKRKQSEGKIGKKQSPELIAKRVEAMKRQRLLRQSASRAFA